jgi:signal transduction histidine kinase
MPRRVNVVTVFDVALVVFIAVETWVNVFGPVSDPEVYVAGPRWLTVPLPLLIALPFLWRRSRPLLMTVLVVSGIALQGIVSGHTPEGYELIAIWIVMPYSVAAFSERRGALSGLAVILAGFAVYAATNDDITHGGAGEQWAGGFFLLVAVGAWLAGLVVRGRRESVVLAERARVLEEEAEAAGAQERARMARELHDIVSHNLSVVVVQAAGARAQAERGGGDQSTLEKIERSGREALVEMRRLLGVLREDDGADPALAPSPGLGQLPALADGIRAAGVAVELDVACGELPPALDLSAYRIVQEALTNTLKHAGPGAHARVVLRRDAEAVTIAVDDDGTGGTPQRTGGHGLVGMRERVALLGGELRAGPGAAGGFAVRARLPLAAGAQP